jgi:hypothetical protein
LELEFGIYGIGIWTVGIGIGIIRIEFGIYGIGIWTIRIGIGKSGVGIIGIELELEIGNWNWSNQK